MLLMFIIIIIIYYIFLSIHSFNLTNKQEKEKKMIPEKLLMNNRRIARKKKKQQNNSQISFAIVGWLVGYSMKRCCCFCCLFIQYTHEKKNHNRSTGVSYAPYIYKNIIHHYHTDTRAHTHTRNKWMNQLMIRWWWSTAANKQTKNQITQTWIVECRIFIPQIKKKLFMTNETDENCWWW